MKSTKYTIRNGKNIIAISHGIDLAIWICDKFGTEVTKQCKEKGIEIGYKTEMR